MRFLAAYVLKGRTQALVVTAVMAILALLLPPLSYFSGASVALVTLRLGARAGLQLSLLATAVTAVLLLVLRQPVELSGVFLLVLWLPVWALAMSLRRTASPARSILLVLLFGVMVLLGLHLAIDDPTQWWQAQLHQLIDPMLQQVPAEEMPLVEANLAELAGQMSGVAVVFLSITLLGCLLLGRWWQAMLFNPGGFGDEFRRLRLGRTLAAVALLLTVVQLLWSGGASALLRDLLALAQVAFALQGIAVAHMLVRLKGLQRGWLVAMYLLLFLGPMVLLLALLGMLDNWFDFRSKYGPGKQAEIK